MRWRAATSCPYCQGLREQLAEQGARIESLTATLEQLQRQLSQVQDQLACARKNSSTSSKPPSSDLVKPPKPPPPAGQSRRQRGGQPGHPKYQRLLVGPELLTAPP